LKEINIETPPPPKKKTAQMAGTTIIERSNGYFPKFERKR